MPLAPTAATFLGVCLFENDRFTRLQAKLEATENGWVRLADFAARFPDEGKVFSLDPHTLGAPEGSLWQFRLIESDRYQPGRGLDRYMAAEVAEPLEVIDLSAFGAEQARRLVVEEGLSLSYQPAARVLVVLTAETCVLVSLSRQQDGRWKSVNSGELARLNVLSFTSDIHRGASYNGRHFVLPRQTPGLHVDVVDWTPDGEFLNHVLRKLRRTESLHPGTETHDLTVRAVERIVLAARSSEVLSADPRENAAMARRLRDFAPALDQGVTGIAEIVQFLCSTPAVSQELEAYKDEARSAVKLKLRSELEPIVRAELTSELAEANASIISAREEAQEARRQLQVAQEDLQAIGALREEQASLVSGEVQAFIDTFGRAGDAIMTAIELAGKVGSVPGTGQTGTGTIDAAPWVKPRNVQARTIGLDQLAAALSTAETRAGLPTGMLNQLDILLRAGEIPLLFGPDAERLLRVYTAAVVAGNGWRVPLDASCLSVDDIWRHPSLGTPTGLALAWRAALDDPAGVFVVVLDDLDAASMSRWFPSFSRFLTSGERPTNLLVAATLLESAEAGPGPRIAHVPYGIPFYVSGNAGTVAAAVLEVGEVTPSVERTRLCPPTVQAVDNASMVSLATSLAAFDGMNSQVAQRTARIYRAAMSTLSSELALDFSLEVAGLLTAPENSTRAPDTLLIQSFALYESRLP